MKILAVCIIATIVACGMPFRSSAETRPNVLLIICDDLNTSLGCYGHPEVHTPNIDRLANQGVRFDNAFAAFTLCNPARTSLLTGLTPATTGIESNSTKPIGFTWMPDYFSSSGYSTGVIGKITHGAFADVMTADTYETADDIGGVDYATACPDPDRGCKGVKDKQDLDARITQRAIRFLRKTEGPFFLAVGLSKPHAPNWGPKKYFDEYDAGDIPLPVPIDDIDGMTDDQRRQAKLAYFACVSFLDKQVGILLDSLDELGLRENTIIVFSGDHGYLLGEHGVWNKHELYYLTSRVPLLVSGPNISPGVAPGIVEHVDILPTLLDLSGIEGGQFEGVSFAPLLSNPSRPWKGAAFVESIADKKSTVDHAVYTDRYTYIEGESGVRLYDREVDPSETFNVIDPSLRAQLRALLSAGWRQALPEQR